jgi:murein DD-endopeptidase MepM/ murein hydrolase activator NlpD
MRMPSEAMIAFKTSANDPVGKQDRESSAARGRAEELERALTAAQQQLEDVQLQRQSVVQERDSLAARLTDTEERMRAANADHAAAVRQLTQETRKSITEVERVFNAISVDPARLVPRGNTAGRGGPFVPWSDRASAQSAAPLAADAVAPNVARLDALTQLLRSMPLAAPLEDFAITSPFGRRTDPFSGERAMHEGIDFRAPLRTPVTATAPGRVVFAGRHGAHGLMVEIEHGHGIHTRYAHLDRITVALGQKVELHQKVGLLGATGRASGPHVHYEIRVDGRPQDPLNFLKAASHVRNAAQQP